MDIKRQALPQSISPQQGQIEPGSTWWLLKNVRASADCETLSKALQEIGWKASAVRPSGPQTWIISSQSAPPTNHLYINGQLAAIVAMGIGRDKQQDKSNQNLVTIQADFSMCPEEKDDSSMASSSTRFEDLKMTLEDKLQGMIGETFKQYDEKIGNIQKAIETQKSDVETLATEVKKEFTNVHQQQRSIETQITTSNNNVVQQMQTMFAQMTSTFNARLDAIDQDKRCRKDGNL